MCLLSFYPPGVPVDTDELIEGITGNPDGVGFAIVTSDGKLVREHAVGVPEMITYTSKVTGKKVTTREVDQSECYKLAYRFQELREKHPDGPAMFHSRFATGGVEDTRGCHPFAVGTNGKSWELDQDTVLAHNGVLFSPAKFEWRSDTRIFAESVLHNVLLGTHNAGIARKAKLRNCMPANLFSKNGIRKVEAYLGSNNKIAVITVNPERMTPGAKARSAEWQYAIYNADQGIWTKAGAWHSNSGYLSYKSYGRTAGAYYGGGGYDSYDSGKSWNADADSVFLGSQYREAESAHVSPDCTFCGCKETVNIVTLVCSMCQTCQDCGELEYEGCSCMTPPSATVPAQAAPDWTPYVPTEPKAITAGKDPLTVAKAEEIGRELLKAMAGEPAPMAPPPGSDDEKAIARILFEEGRITREEFAEIVPEDAKSCSCQVWCGATGCLPEDGEPVEVVISPKGAVIQGAVLPEKADSALRAMWRKLSPVIAKAQEANEAARLSALDM